MFKSLLQMHEGASCLDQALEKIRVAGVGFQPKLFENVMRFVVTLLVPALKKGAIKWMLCQIGAGKVGIARAHLRHELRNPLAFAHEELNLQVALMMSKRAAAIFFEQFCHPASGRRIHTASTAVLP
jgi:hypothetical protein